MLLDKNGKIYDPKNLPKDRKTREKVLAGLTEVLEPRRVRNRMFYLENRAKVRS